MSKNKQVIVWEAFAGLIDEEGLEFELIKEMQSKHCNFIGEIYTNYTMFWPAACYYKTMYWESAAPLLQLLNSSWDPLAAPINILLSCQKKINLFFTICFQNQIHLKKRMLAK